MFQDDGSSSVTSTPTLVQMFPSGMGSQSPYPWLKELKSEERGLCLIHLLLTCAKHVASGNFEHANIALDQISHLSSPEGDTMQRIASYFAEALANRILKTWPGIYKALHSTKISFPSDNILVKKMFFEYFPYLKIAFVITNQVIIEAMEGEKIVHVVDLNAAEPTQWRSLIRDLSARPEGPPHLRITGVHPQKEVLDQMARVLIEEAEKLDIPFQFNPIVSKIENLDIEKLNVKTGEALAISSVLQFHSLLAPDDEVVKSKNGVHFNGGFSACQDTASSSPLSSTQTSTKIDGFLNALRGLSPKVMVVAEQDSNHNNSALMERLSESLYFYAALFDCLESTLPRTSMERMKVEKMLFGEEIKNIISCEGSERKERHEKLEKWVQRLDLAGFRCVPLSYYALLQARRLLQGYSCDGCRIKEENGCVVMCWQDRPLFSVSAWKTCRR
uniref:scarecrow-like protein 3 n=1 Tax=Erigeron canadensis TaxID=72917 RepID=UPI001CB97D64|nr:scarecrow-like protein 3 [Erigeron canadensis]